MCGCADVRMCGCADEKCADVQIEHVRMNEM
jgi:hypothetical protein